MTKPKIITSLPFELASDPLEKLIKSGASDLVIDFYVSTFVHSQFSDGLELLEEAHSMSGLDNVGLIITGIPGIGKSTLLNTYVKNTYAKECNLPTDVLTPLPILKVRVPGSPTIPRTIEKILMTSEHLVPSARRTDTLDRRLHQLITHQRVEMIIFDEFQHLLPENSTKRTSNATINFIKTLADDYNLAFCFAGLPSMPRVLDGFDEIKDRLAFGELEMKPFAVDTADERNDFNKFINSILKKIEELGVDCSDLKRENMDRTTLLMRILLASEGKARHIMMLFAKVLSKVAPGDSITNINFEKVYARQIKFKRGIVFNPFSAQKPALEKQINVMKVIEKNELEEKYGKKRARR